MFFKWYEMRFVREDGRVLRGPIFGKNEYSKMQNIVDQLDNLSVLRMKFGRQRIVIPANTLSNGHAEIRRVGLVYFLIRTWRCRG